MRELVKRWLRMCGDAFNGSVRDRLNDLDREVGSIKRELQNARIAETEAALLQASIHVVENLHALASRTVVESSASLDSAERALLGFLYSHVPSRAAIASGDSHDLKTAGFEVYSCARQAVEATVAQGNGRGSRSSANWRDLPDRPGILSLGEDPAGSLREFGDFGACVVAAQLNSQFEPLVSEMRDRQYHWFLVLYRSAARPETLFYANYATVIADSTGTAFFFRDFRAFAEAQAWCAATLNRTYFAPAQNGATAPPA